MESEREGAYSTGTFELKGLIGYSQINRRCFGHGDIGIEETRLSVK